MQRGTHAARALAVEELTQVHILLCNRKPRLTLWNSDNCAVPYWRLYWNRTTGATLIHKDLRISLRPNLLCLVSPNTTTSTRITQSVDHYYIHFVADPPFDAVAPGITQFPATPDVTDAFLALAQFREAEPRQKQILSPRVFFICYYALSKVAPETLGPGYRDQRIRTAIACMDASPALPVTNHTIARAVGMHPTAFIRLFKQCTGYSPRAFLQIRRIDRACRLLHFSRHSIDEIASATGFYDRFHFSRVFKKIRGTTPAVFRRQLRP